MIFLARFVVGVMFFPPSVLPVLFSDDPGKVLKALWQISEPDTREGTLFF